MSAADGDGLAPLVSERAAAVAQEAMRLAHDTAVARLASLLADALVTSALQELTPAPAREPAGAAAPKMPARPAEGLYSYAITWSRTQAPHIRSLTDMGQVELLPDDDLALVVSREHLDDLDVDEDDLSEEGDLARLVRGHDAVVRAVFEHGPVLPLRFATVVPDEAGGQQLLRSHADAAREQLRHVEGAVEWGLRLVRMPGSETVPQPRHESSGSGASPESGTEYLARRREALRVREADNEAAAAAAERITAELSYTVDAIRHGGHPGSSLLLDVAYLVTTATEGRFREDTDRLARELAAHGLMLELTGPWPPYSFATLAQEVTDVRA
jgi:hypothetical protein